ncbi:hypothetical protein [Xanthomonas sp. SS]|uniref:hypothetical protein n=1 Tax=Xanthomonas sp. SS TaxID=2724122 RepID=UPI0021049FC0|nr:hypothetical protein [Xanthomonas sp. SS]
MSLVSGEVLLGVSVFGCEITGQALGTVVVTSGAVASSPPSMSPPQELNRTLSNAQGNPYCFNPLCIFIG